MAKRACDGCKIRKIRCLGGTPCKGCSDSALDCTFNKAPRNRGPRTLRASTKRLIAVTQGDTQPHHDGPTITSPWLPTTPARTRSRIRPAVLALQLYIYHLRMFPIWPVINVEATIAAIHRDEDDWETYALATAVVAATMAQLRLGSPAGMDDMTVEIFEAECQYARTQYNYRERINLTQLRTAFFLHVYHENREDGRGASSLYLREAISIAQMMNLHRECSYPALETQEQQLRRRVLWLLFITERAVCILHKLPVILKISNVQFPALDYEDDFHVLPAFLDLVNLFWAFDRSGMFEKLQGQEDEDSAFQNDPTPTTNVFHSLQNQLDEDPLEENPKNDVQKADIWVTRQWMRAILWKIATKNGLLAVTGPDQAMSPSFPITVAREFLGITSRLPTWAMEAHGLGMELKIYDIACSVADGLVLLPPDRSRDWVKRSNNTLARLHEVLTSFRGGNQALVDKLCEKMAVAHQNGLSMIPVSMSSPRSSSFSIAAPYPRLSEIIGEECEEPQQNISDVNGASNIDLAAPMSHLAAGSEYPDPTLETFAFDMSSQCLQQEDSAMPGFEWLLSNTNQNQHSGSDTGAWPFDSFDQQIDDRQLCDLTMPATNTTTPLST